ncbi:MAG: hypothetical protein ABIN36_09665 [Ferruginibacter sp.]
MNHKKVLQDNNLNTLRVILLGYGFRKRQLSPRLLTDFNRSLFDESFITERFPNSFLLNEIYKQFKAIIEIKRIQNPSELNAYLIELRKKEALILITMSQTLTGDSKKGYKILIDNINIESSGFLKAKKQSVGISISHCNYIEDTYALLQSNFESISSKCKTVNSDNISALASNLEHKMKNKLPEPKKGHRRKQPYSKFLEHQTRNEAETLDKFRIESESQHCPSQKR